MSTNLDAIESCSDAVVLSESLSNTEIAVSNEVKVVDNLLESKSETLAIKPSSDQDACGGLVVHESVDEARVSGDETATVMEKVLDENEVIHEEKEGEYKVKDLVWGKVKSYPWWPGQIFDPSSATDKARKYSNKKGFLIAYFGDQSFAWNEPSKIKPFRKHFSKMKKQSNSKAFYHAVSCALDEVARRVEFGLTCSCLSEEAYDKIKSQVFVNAGIREEASRIDGGDNVSTAATFKAVNIVRSVKDLAREHFDGISSLEVFTVRSQLLSFYRWKGYYQLSALSLLDESDNKLEDNSEVHLIEKDKMVEDEKQESVGEKILSKKRKLNACDDVSRKHKHVRKEDEKIPIKKEKSLTKVTPNGRSSVPSKENKSKKDGGKRTTVERNDSKELKDDEMIPSKKEKSVTKVTPNGRSSVPSKENKTKKDGGKRTTIEGNDSKGLKDDEMTPSKKEKSVTKVTPNGRENKSKNDGGKRTMVERNDSKEESRNGVADKKSSNASPKKLFRVGDSICRIARQLSESPSIFKKESQKAKPTSTEEKHIPKSVPKKKSQSREKNDERCVKQADENEHESDDMEADGHKDTEDNASDKIIPSNPEEQVVSEPETGSSPKSSKENSATALILKFTDLDSIPSVTHLNEIFSRYGPVRETETQVLKKNNCAKVVFEAQSNAETAFSSAGKFSLFGPSLISYRLDYSPTPRKTLASDRKQNKKDGKSEEEIQVEE